MNELKIFTSNQFGQIRTTSQNGEPLFVAADVCRALDIGNSRMATDRLDEDEKADVSLTDGSQVRHMTAVTESGLYSLVLGSRKPEAKAFKRWITHEVIPSIRKTGGYVNDASQFVDSYFPQLRQDQKQAISLMLDESKRMGEKIAIDAPKVLFADAVTTSHTSILVGELAKIIKQNGVDVGQNRLFDWLRSNGYLIRRQGTDYNMPTQRSMEQGLFEIKETVIAHSDGHTSINKTPKVTGKGQQYFVSRLLSGGG